LKLSFSVLRRKLKLKCRPKLPHAVIVGAGLGGLSAAIHLRLDGWDVTVLEARDQCGGKATTAVEAGFTFDLGPSIIIMPDIYRAVFDRAGKSMDEYLQFVRLDTISRIYFEGLESFIDLPADEAGCLEVIKQQAPEDLTAFRELLNQVESVYPDIAGTIFSRPYHQPWQMLQPGLARFARKFSVRTPFKRDVDRRFRSPLLRAFFYGFPAYGGQSYHSRSPGSYLIPWSMIRGGVYWPVGGVSAIPLAFERLARELGVEFFYNRPATGLRREQSRVTAVQTPCGEVQADLVVSNRDRLTTEPWVREAPAPRPSFSYFTVHYGFNKPAPALSHHTLLVPADFERGFEQLYDQRQFPQRPIVYLNEVSAVEPAMSSSGGANVFAVITSPSDEPQLDWTDRAEEYQLQVEKLVRSFDLGLDFDGVVVQRRQTPNTFANRDGNYYGSLYGPSQESRLWGFMPLRIQDEKFPNLFFVGGSVQPGAGLPMVTLSGKFVAEKARPLRR